MAIKTQLTLCLLLLCFAAWAQGRPESRLSVIITQASVGSQGFEDFGGKIGANVTTLAAKWGAFSLGYGQQRYDWDDTLELPFGDGRDPWDEFHTVRFGVGIFRPLGRGWFVRHQLGMVSSFEAETDHSLSFRATSVLIRRWEDFWFSFGIVARAHQRLDGVVVPALGLRWRPDKTGWSAALGLPITEIRYGFTEDFSVALGWAFEFGVVSRLSDHNDVIPKGYARRSGSGIGVSLKWQVQDHLDLRLQLASIGRRRLEFFDSHGDEIADFDIDRGTSAKMVLSLRF